MSGAARGRRIGRLSVETREFHESFMLFMNNELLMNNGSSLIHTHE